MAYIKINTSGATKSASSTYGSHPADLAFDNDINTYWWSSGNADNQWIKIQFSSAKQVSKIRVYFNDVPHAIFRLEGSNDDSNWTTVVDNLDWNSNQWNESEFTNSNSYLYYRLYCVSGDGTYWLKVMEWELYELVALYDITTDIRAKKKVLNDILSDVRFYHSGLYNINTNIKFKKNFVYVEWSAPTGFDGLGFTYYYTTDGSEPNNSSNYTTNTHLYWTLSEGLNILKIKVKDSLGNWGMTSSFRLVYSDNDIEGGVAN